MELKVSLKINLDFSQYIIVKGNLEDPSIAEWLLDPKEEMDECYSPEKLEIKYHIKKLNFTTNKAMNESFPVFFFL